MTLEEFNGWLAFMEYKNQMEAEAQEKARKKARKR